MKKILKIKEMNFAQNKKRLVVIGLCAAAVLIGGGIYLADKNTAKEKSVYRETTVAYGVLTVGVENSGAVEVGTLEQEFELDLSEYVSSSSYDSSSASSGSGFGMPETGSSGSGNRGGFSQMQQLMNGMNTGTSGSDNSMKISEVRVTTGQEIAVGDVLYVLDGESVEDIRSQLAADVESAKADLDSISAENLISELTAQQTLDSNKAYGVYAAAEYDKTMYDLEKAITDLEEDIAELREDLEKEKEDLETAKSDYEMVQNTADNFEWSVKHMSAKDELGLYLDYENQRETIQKQADSLEDSIEKSEDKIEEYEEKLADYEFELKKTQRALEEGKLTAKRDYDLRILSSNTADENYDISTSLLALKYKEQEEEYQDAMEKLEEFDNTIHDNCVISEFAGVITEVPLDVDDTIGTGTSLLTVYDDSDTTITVSVDDSDIKQLAEGGAVNIRFTAYPDTLYKGEISNIDDADTDSSGNITYPVEVKVLGDVSELYEGMTGDLTFITRESEEVTYVSVRAITRRNGKSYVKMRDDKGNIVEKEVVTGFSDGENAEIKSGLKAGDTVLIESKVAVK